MRRIFVEFPMFAIAVIILMACRSPLRAQDATASSTAGEASLAAISPYRTWHRVNAPTLMDPVIASLCEPSGSTTLSIGKLRSQPLLALPTETPKTTPDPHAMKYLRVFVNDIGLAEMIAEQPHFTPGTIIVKEKLNSAENDYLQKYGPPELLTVMVKRQPGFDREHGDWEYLVVDGAASKIEVRGKLENCRSCHDSQASTDYVFRHYLPADVRQRVRESIQEQQPKKPAE